MKTWLIISFLTLFLLLANADEHVEHGGSTESTRPTAGASVDPRPDCTALWKPRIIRDTPGGPLRLDNWLPTEPSWIKSNGSAIVCRFTNEYGWVWSQAGDGKILLAGTRVQGARLGFTGADEKNYFELKQDGRWMPAQGSRTVMRVKNNAGEAEIIEQETDPARDATNTSEDSGVSPRQPPDRPSHPRGEIICRTRM
jgi:hypothetical protein